MYRRIMINNFKSLKKVLINPALITVLVGPNGSGKSSVLQALTLLKQSAGFDNLRTDGPIINLGKFQDLLSQGTRKMGLAISGDLPVWKKFEFFEESVLKYDISLRFDAPQGLISVSATVGTMFVNLEVSWNRDEKPTTGKVGVEARRGVFEFEYEAQPNISIPLSLTSRAYRGEKASIWRDLTTITKTVHNQLDLTFNVPPFRGQDLPQYNLKGGPELQLTSTSVSVEQASRLASTVAYHRDLVESKISNWIERITGVGPNRIDTWIKLVVATGPNRNVLAKTNLSVHFAAPAGDVMMTGTRGLVEANKRKFKLG